MVMCGKTDRDVAACDLWTRSELVQVIACRLYAPCHYMNQFWLIVNCTLRNNLQRRSNRKGTLFIKKCVWKCRLRNDNHFVHGGDTVYPKKYAHGFVVLCFVVVMQSFIMNSHEVFIHIHQCCFAGTGAIVRLPQCQWSKPDGYG